MKQINLILGCILVSFIFSSCSRATSENQNSPSNENKIEAVSTDENAEGVLQHKDDSLLNKEDYHLYKYEDNEVVQIIEIRGMTENNLQFSLTSRNKSTNRISSIDGTAIALGGDYEIDEDEEGYAYPAVQYVYEKECWLAIRIDAENKDKLRIIEANCEEIREADTPFSSKGLMHKVK